MDDELVIASKIATILNLPGFHANPFYSAEEAISGAEASGPPEIVITDGVMPGKTGIDLAIHS